MRRIENLPETIGTIIVGFGIGFGITSFVLLTQIGLIRW